MKNWTRAVEMDNDRVETDCRPSLQSNETQPNKKIQPHQYKLLIIHC